MAISPFSFGPESCTCLLHMRDDCTVWPCIGGSRGGLRGFAPPSFQISKIKESNKTKQKIEDSPLEKEEERKSCMFV